MEEGESATPSLQHVLRKDLGIISREEDEKRYQVEEYVCLCGNNGVIINDDCWNSVFGYLLYLSDLQICFSTRSLLQDMIDDQGNKRRRELIRESHLCGAELESNINAFLDYEEHIPNMNAPVFSYPTTSPQAIAYSEVMNFLIQNGVKEEIQVNTFKARIMTAYYRRPHAFVVALAIKYVTREIVNKLIEKLSLPGEEFLLRLEIERNVLIRANMAKIYSEIIAQHKRIRMIN